MLSHTEQLRNQLRREQAGQVNPPLGSRNESHSTQIGQRTATLPRRRSSTGWALRHSGQVDDDSPETVHTWWHPAQVSWVFAALHRRQRNPPAGGTSFKQPHPAQRQRDVMGSGTPRPLTWAGPRLRRSSTARRSKRGCKRTAGSRRTAAVQTLTARVVRDDPPGASQISRHDPSHGGHRTWTYDSTRLRSVSQLCFMQVRRARDPQPTNQFPIDRSTNEAVTILGFERSADRARTSEPGQQSVDGSAMTESTRWTMPFEASTSPEMIATPPMVR